jgi:capsular exopolysaccharide synthesis family protein
VAKKMSDAEVQDETFRSTIARQHQLFDSTIKLAQDKNLAKEFGGFDAQTIAPAVRAPKAEPRAFPVFAVSGFLGLLVGFGLGYLAERSDQGFRTPEEIRKRLGLPVVGHIPLMVADQEVVREAEATNSPLDPILYTHYRSLSREAEAYRGVRTALYFSLLGKDHKVIQITSPTMGDGKTTLAANLGVSIAQSGKRIILIDADFRRPRLHKVFGASAKVGLASVIAGDVALAAAIQDSGIAGLSVLPCGPIPPNPAELLTSPRFKEVLDEIRGQFEFVVVDTPPLLAVTDPCAVAPRVDGVLLNIRVSKNARPNAERAKEILSTLGVNVLGLVVNGVDENGAGGYGGGHYGYGYGYAYSNGYRSEPVAEGADLEGDRQEEEPALANGHTNGHGRQAANGSGGKSGSGVLRWLRKRF